MVILAYNMLLAWVLKLVCWQVIILCLFSVSLSDIRKMFKSLSDKFFDMTKRVLMASSPYDVEEISASQLVKYWLSLFNNCTVIYSIVLYCKKITYISLPLHHPFSLLVHLSVPFPLHPPCPSPLSMSLFFILAKWKDINFFSYNSCVICCLN